MQKRNKKGEYRPKRKWKLKLLTVVAIGVGGYILVDMPNTSTIEFPLVEKVATDDLGDKLSDTRKMVEAGIKAKEQVNADNLLVERAEQAYKDAVAIHNASVAEYNLTLEAMELYGGGALPIFFEIATERNLLDDRLAVIE